MRFVERFLWILIVSAVTYFALLNLYSYSAVNRIGNDSINFILPSLAPNFNMGVPYKDYFENNPPGILLLTNVWSIFFGYSNLSFKIFHFITLVSSGLLFYLITKIIFNRYFGALLTLFASIILFSIKINSFMLTSEQVGLCFSLLGLLFIMRISDHHLFWRYFLSSAFLFLASQMKDPFGPSLICFIPIFIYYLTKNKRAKFFKVILSVFLGIAIPSIIIISYLFILGSWDAYIGIVSLKTEIYRGNFNPKYLILNLSSMMQRIKDMIIYWQYSYYYLLIPFIVISFIKPIKKELFNKKSMIYLVVLFYAVGNFIGFLIQANVGSHYLIQVVIPIYFFMGFIVFMLCKFLFRLSSKLFNKNIYLQFLLRIIIVLLVIASLFPKYLDSYQYNEFSLRKLMLNLTEGQKTPPLEKYISEKTRKDDCVLSLYGWGTPATYFYSQRRPCTRFYTPNLISEKNKAEFREQILKNPPAVIYYSLIGADMDVVKFENSFFNLTRALKYCYKKDIIYEELFLAIGSRKQTADCIAMNGYFFK